MERFTWTVLGKVAQPAARFEMETRAGSGLAFVWFRNAGNATARDVRVGAEPPETMKSPATDDDQVEPGKLTDELVVAPTLNETAAAVRVEWVDQRSARHCTSGRIRF
jgi:hypothetical protein